MIVNDTLAEFATRYRYPGVNVRTQMTTSLVVYIAYYCLIWTVVYGNETEGKSLGFNDVLFLAQSVVN